MYQIYPKNCSKQGLKGFQSTSAGLKAIRDSCSALKWSLVLGRVDGNSSYNSMGDNWGSHRSAQVKLEFLKTYIFSSSNADTSPKQ